MTNWGKKTQPRHSTKRNSKVKVQKWGQLRARVVCTPHENKAGCGKKDVQLSRPLHETNATNTENAIRCFTNPPSGTPAPHKQRPHPCIRGVQ